MWAQQPFCCACGVIIPHGDGDLYPVLNEQEEKVSRLLWSRLHRVSE